MKIIALPDLHEGAILIDLIAEPLSEADLVLLVGDLTNTGTAASAAEVVNTVRKYNRCILLPEMLGRGFAEQVCKQHACLFAITNFYFNDGY